MAQSPATRYQSSGSAIDYTPGTAVTAGTVVVQGSVVGITTEDIEANKPGSLALEGVFKVPKITGSLGVGTLAYWDPTGNPVSGDAGSGAATGTAGALKQMGYVAEAALSADKVVKVVLSKA